MSAPAEPRRGRPLTYAQLGVAVLTTLAINTAILVWQVFA